MTTFTDDAREWLADLSLGNVSTQIDAVAIGTGKNEGPGASALANQEYRTDTGDPNVTITDTGTGSYSVALQVTGGTEIPAGTQITEMGILADGIGGGGILVFIDQFDYIEVPGGETVEFPIDDISYIR